MSSFFFVYLTDKCIFSSFISLISAQYLVFFEFQPSARRGLFILLIKTFRLGFSSTTRPWSCWDVSSRSASIASSMNWKSSMLNCLLLGALFWSAMELVSWYFSVASTLWKTQYVHVRSYLVTFLDFLVTFLDDFWQASGVILIANSTVNHWWKRQCTTSI